MQRDLIRSLAVRSASGLPVHVAASPAAPFSTSLRLTRNAMLALTGGFFIISASEKQRD
jgi:hypothetical protein